LGSLSEPLFVKRDGRIAVRQGLMGWACLAVLGLGSSAQAQQRDTYFYDVQGVLSG
jgi:hypothetical protein